MKAMHAGDLVVDRDGLVSGMIGGSVIVRGGARVTLDAMDGGDFIVEDGSVEVRGMVGGRIVGDATVKGMVAR